MNLTLEAAHHKTPDHGHCRPLRSRLSNLADRLGASSLFHAGLPRGSIDWIPVPRWPTARTNLADVAIALGALALAYQPARKAMHALRTRSGGGGSVADGSPAVSEQAATAPGTDSTNGTRTSGGLGGTRRTWGTVHAGRSLSAVAVVLAVASWTMFWQANRQPAAPTRLDALQDRQRRRHPRRRSRRGLGLRLTRPDPRGGSRSAAIAQQ